jgi:hypothetical protein
MDVGEVGRRRTGEENLPKEGGLNKRNGLTIDGQHLACTRTPPTASRPFAPHPALIDRLCEREAESCDFIRPVGNALLHRITHALCCKEGERKKDAMRSVIVSRSLLHLHGHEQSQKVEKEEEKAYRPPRHPPSCSLFFNIILQPRLRSRKPSPTARSGNCFQVRAHPCAFLLARLRRNPSPPPGPLHSLLNDGAN